LNSLITEYNNKDDSEISNKKIIFPLLLELNKCLKDQTAVIPKTLNISKLGEKRSVNCQKIITPVKVGSESANSLDTSIDALSSDASESSSDDDSPDVKKIKPIEGELTKRDLTALKNIERLDKFLQNLNSKIIELEDKPIDLDELGSKKSTYLLESIYKQKFSKAYAKFVDLTKKYKHLVDMDDEEMPRKNVGGIFRTKFKFSSTKYPEINSDIEKFLNTKRQFPDFHDIKKLVTVSNSKNNLNISNDELEKIAIESFEKIGKKLKERREKDDNIINDSRINSLRSFHKKKVEDLKKKKISTNTNNSNGNNDSETDTPVLEVDFNQLDKFPQTLDKQTEHEMNERLKASTEKADKVPKITFLFKFKFKFQFLMSLY
jgi:hypothetical protein